MKTIKLILLAALLGISFAANAMDDFPIRPGATGSLDDADEFLDIQVHVISAGAFDMSISNNGYFGNSGPGRSDALINECTDLWAPQLEYPRGSGIQYLWQGGLWIGAVVETDTGDVPRVSVSVEGWFSSADNELYATTYFTNHSVQEGRTYCDGSEMFDPESFAAQQFESTFLDTNTTLPTGPPIDHPIDGNHIPLGIQVDQRLLGFSAYGYDKFAIIEYTLQNIGNYQLKDLCIGLYLDADVGLINTAEYTDDITGFLEEYEGETANIAWIADNHGRNSSGEVEATSVMGVTVLQSPEDVPFGGYNWWVSNGVSDLDFGPAWAATDHWTEVYGTPVSDDRKYELLRNGEIDYPQYRVDEQNWIATHPQVTIDPNNGNEVSHPWFAPDLSFADDLADGYDARFLISWGPLGEEVGGVHRFAPGEEITLSLAVLIGDDFHDPAHPQPEEGVDPSLFNFEDLVATAQTAKLVYQDMAANAPPAPPYEVTAYPGFSGTVLTWPALPTIGGVEYNVYKRLSAEVDWPDTPLNSEPLVHQSFVDRNAFPGSGIQYRIEAIRNGTITSYPSPTFALPDVLLSPINGLTAGAGDASVALEWDPLNPQNVEQYHIFRSEDPEVAFSEWVEVGTTIQPSFTDDDDIVNGKYYWYAVAASYNDHLSQPSFTARQIPLNLEGELLVVLEYSTENALNNWSLEDVIDYYTSMMIDLSIPAGFKQVNMDEADTLMLSDLADYGKVWFVFDRGFGVHPDYAAIRDETIRHYSELGGKLIVSGKECRSILAHDNDGYSLSSVLGFNELLPCSFSTNDSTANFDRAVAILDDLPDLTVLPERPFAVHIVGEVANLVPTGGTTPLYWFESIGQSSQYEGVTVGLYNPASETYGSAILMGVPLYAVGPREDVLDAVTIMLDLLDSEPAVSGPAPGGDPVADLATGGVLVHPNPFNAATTVSMHLPHTTQVAAKLYNMLGQEVWHISPQRMSAGHQQFTIRGNDLPSGIYFLHLQLGTKVQTRKVLLLK